MRRVLCLLFVMMLCGCPRSGGEDVRKGHVYFAAGKLDEAATAYEAAAQADPKSSVAREGRANVAYERGALDVAERWYKTAIEANPRTITARNKLALTQVARGDVPAALATLKTALELAPDNTYALYMMGGLYLKSGRVADAERSYQSALEIDPDHYAARLAFGSLLLDTGRAAEAEHQFTKLATAGQSALADYGLARVAGKAGRGADAAQYLERVLDGGASRPKKILHDSAFAGVWGDPAMARIRTRLSTATSTVN